MAELPYWLENDRPRTRRAAREAAADADFTGEQDMRVICRPIPLILSFGYH
jgi:hypothetical protein